MAQVFVSYLPPAVGRPPGRAHALRASEIRESLLDALSPYIGRKVDDGLIPLIQHEHEDILDHQCRMRSVLHFEPRIRHIYVEMDAGSRIVVLYPPGWDEAVDRHLRNRDCDSCGGLVTVGVPHTLDDCRLALANVVLST